MNKGMIKAIIILPGTVVVFIPVALLLLTDGTRWAVDLQTPAEVTFYAAVLLFVAGGYLSSVTARLFVTVGEGTPAPWEPPQKFVIRGPYRYIRNPMITGVILVLFGESLLFNSWPILLWALLFLVGNLIYIPAVEEKGLLVRFGSPYQEYRGKVPPWIPRLVKWVQ